MRRLLYLGVVISASAFAQVTTLQVSAARQASQLVPDAQGNLQDLINHNTTANYVVTVRNTGTSRAFGVTLTGSFAPAAPPPGPTTISAVAPAANCSVGADRLSFTCNNLGTLEASLPDGQLPDGGFLASTTTTVTVTVRLGLPPAGSGCTAGMLLGTLSVTGSGTNVPVPATASTGGTTVRPLADLAVSMTGPGGANENDIVTFQVSARNNGPCASNRVRLGDLNGNSSAGLVWQSNSGGCPGGFPCILGNPWPAGASVNITSTYQVAPLRDTITSLTTTGNINEMDIASSNTVNPDGGAPLALATLDPVASNNSAITSTSVTNTSGCSAVGTSSLTLFGLALVVVALRRYRRS